MLKNLFFGIGLILSVSACSQKLYQNIRGKITDRASEAPLIGATVQLLNADPPKGASTDVNGNFILEKVPLGRHNLRISYIGYEDAVLSNILVGSAKEVILNVLLQESFIQMKTIEVSATNPKERANNEMAMVSSRSFSTDETSRFAASVDDPARMALSFAGVSTSDDLSNEIIIRGNSPLGMLWRMNGIEIPSPSHFSDEGASSGGISALSVNMLDNSDFFTGAFPAEYGNATSGVFDVKLKNGNNQKREYAFQLGVLGTDIALEGPLKEGYTGSYLINYRYSTLSILTGLGIIDTGDEDNLFQDLAFQFNLPTKKHGIFKIFGLGGLSSAIGEADRDTVQANPFNSYDDSEFISNFGILGASNKYFFSDKTYWENTLAFSRQSIGYEEDLINPFTLNTQRVYEDRFVNDALRFSSLLNHKFSSRSTLRSGLIGSQLNYDLYGEGEDDEGEHRRFLEEKGGTQTFQTYAQWKYRLTEQWTMNLGLHSLHLSLNGKTTLEPRAGIQYAWKEIHQLSFGFGLHSRIAPLSTYNATTIDDFGNESKGNRDLNISKALHYVLGYDRQLSENVHLKLETYYQALYDIWVFDDPNFSFSAVNANSGYTSRELSDEGTATNIGIELTLEKFFTQNSYYLFTASIYDSKYQMPDGREFDSRYDMGYNFSLLGGKEYEVGEAKKNLLGVNLRFTWAGGNRYRPILLSESRQTQSTVRDNTVGFSEYAPDYYRADLTLSYRINKEALAHIISLQAQNITARQNVFNYYYNETEDRILPDYQFGIIPVLKYRIEF